MDHIEPKNWITNATIEWADEDQEPVEGAWVIFDSGWLHIWGQLRIRTVPASAVASVRWPEHQPRAASQ